MRAKSVQLVDVQLEPYDLFQELLKHIDNRLGMEGRWVQDGSLCEDDDHPHGTPGTVKLGPASEKQKQWDVVRQSLRGVWSQL